MELEASFVEAATSHERAASSDAAGLCWVLKVEGCWQQCCTIALHTHTADRGTTHARHIGDMHARGWTLKAEGGAHRRRMGIFLALAFIKTRMAVLIIAMPIAPCAACTVWPQHCQLSL